MPPEAPATGTGAEPEKCGLGMLRFEKVVRFEEREVEARLAGWGCV